MSGIVNSTGAKSGIIGTTVGTPDGGKVLQVQSTVVTARNSSTDIDTSGTGTDVGLNVTLTAQSPTSDFLIQLSVGVAGSDGSNSLGFILSKDGTKIGNGIDSSARNGAWVRSIDYVDNTNHTVGLSASYLDTASGSGSRTYKAGLVTQASGGAAYINMHAGTDYDNTNIYSSYTSSSLTVLEIEVL